MKLLQRRCKTEAEDRRSGFPTEGKHRALAYPHTVKSAAMLRGAAFWGVAITVLGGCASTLNPALSSRGIQIPFLQPDVHGYAVLYSFDGKPDGQGPLAIGVVSGSLYGTTLQGGDAGDGTVFRSSLSGDTKILYSFQGGNDGSEPSSGLTEFKGSLYGATHAGGGTGCRYSAGCGTVYAIESSGKERVVYRFKPNNVDGWFPGSSLVPINGVLYGSTTYGYQKTCGYYGCGRIFSIDSTGRERVIYAFKGGADGCWPVGLLAIKGTLYGITQGGGAGTSQCNTAENGTVFAVTTSGKETVLHGFSNTPDGAAPSSLIAVDGVLYGTTIYGGSQSCEGGNRECGVVFSVTRSGRERVLYRFNGYSDGRGPNSLIWLNNELYGTTNSGGVDDDLGTIFSLTRSGMKATLYRFKGGSRGGHDGFNPRGLTFANGTIYGITGQGGTGTGCSYTCGTIYRIAP